MSKHSDHVLSTANFLSFQRVEPASESAKSSQRLPLNSNATESLLDRNDTVIFVYLFFISLRCLLTSFHFFVLILFLGLFVDFVFHNLGSRRRLAILLVINRSFARNLRFILLANQELLGSRRDEGLRNLFDGDDVRGLPLGLYLGLNLFSFSHIHVTFDQSDSKVEAFWVK